MPPQTETKMKRNRGFTALRQRRKIAELIVLVEIEPLEGRETAQRGWLSKLIPDWLLK
jgi:hypothetical protein